MKFDVIYFWINYGEFEEENFFKKNPEARSLGYF
jgi:hypothetical protein